MVQTFQLVQLTINFVYSSTSPKPCQTVSRDPAYATLSGLTHTRFGLFPVRSPLLRESLLLSFPGGTKMFQFSPLHCLHYVFLQAWHCINHAGLPHSEISGSKDVQLLPEAYRSLPRLSSSPDTKASTVCSQQLSHYTQINLNALMRTYYFLFHFLLFTTTNCQRAYKEILISQNWPVNRFKAYQVSCEIP